jgi:hypothetical protein
MIFAQAPSPLGSEPAQRLRDHPLLAHESNIRDLRSDVIMALPALPAVIRNRLATPTNDHRTRYT